MSEEGEGALGQEEREGDEVEAGQAGGESLVVPREAAEARGPRERALDDPPAREQHEAALGLRGLDDLQADAVGGGGRRGVLAGVALPV